MLVLCREIGRDDLVGWALLDTSPTLSIAWAVRGRQRLPRSRACVCSSRVGDAQVLAWTLVLLGSTLATRGEPEGAATLLGAAEGIIDRADGGFTGAEAELHAETVAELATALAGEGLRRACIRGPINVDRGRSRVRRLSPYTDRGVTRWTARSGRQMICATCGPTFLPARSHSSSRTWKARRSCSTSSAPRRTTRL